MKIITPEVWKAREAARKTATTSKKYSKLKIIRLLEDQWETYRTQLEESGLLDQFMAAEYLAEDDPVFAAFLAGVPEEIRDLLEQCLWEE